MEKIQDRWGQISFHNVKHSVCSVGSKVVLLSLLLAVPHLQ
jgi:hypothetical protein